MLTVKEQKSIRFEYKIFSPQIFKFNVRFRSSIMLITPSVTYDNIIYSEIGEIILNENVTSQTEQKVNDQLTLCINIIISTACFMVQLKHGKLVNFLVP